MIIMDHLPLLIEVNPSLTKVLHLMRTLNEPLLEKREREKAPLLILIHKSEVKEAKD